MIRILRTTATDSRFQELIKELDSDLKIRDGDVHWYYDQFNKVDQIKYVLIAFYQNELAACGAIKEFDNYTMEIKRMHTRPDYRRNGIASKILNELEGWAAELGYHRCILETGIWQPEAIGLYEHMGYRRIENYGQYAGRPESCCFEKKLA